MVSQKKTGKSIKWGLALNMAAPWARRTVVAPSYWPATPVSLCGWQHSAANRFFWIWRVPPLGVGMRSEEHTSELQSLMRISYAVFCLKKKKYNVRTPHYN